MIALDESFDCQYCHNGIGSGIVIEQICVRYQPICISCRWDIINANVYEYNLSLSAYFREKVKMDLSKDYCLAQIEKYEENIHQMKIIDCLSEAIHNWGG